MNPFDLRGPQFLLFYAILSAVVLATAAVLCRSLEPSGGAPTRLTDPYLIAFLRGGPLEAVRVAMLALLDRGLLVASGSRVATAPGAEAGHVARPLERAVLSAAAVPVEESWVARSPACLAACGVMQDVLAEQGLVPDAAARRRRRTSAVWVAILLLGVGGTKIVVALHRGRTNVLILVILMVIVALATAKLLLGPRRTPRGSALLADLERLFGGLRDRASHLRKGGATSELALLAGVFGLAAVPIGIMDSWTRVFAREVTQAGGCGSSGCGSSGCGGGGGGGCGGGCGGCGG